MSTNNKTPLLEKGIVLNGKWEIVEHISTGGKGEVYRARQLKLEREVAFKIISQDLLSSFDGDEEEIQTEIERFRREVLTMAQVRHPNILQVYDQDRAVIEKNGAELTIEYIVMEYIPGPTLRSTIPPEGLQNNEKEIRKWIRDFFLPVLDGVEAIHDLGIVHRDLKPENVLLDEFTPKIADFGLAGGPRWQRVTRSHHMDGTFPYMSKEQLTDMGETDFRGDIYALGKILYEVVIGKMTKDTTFPFKTAHLSNPTTPFLKRLDRIIQQATAEDKKKRISSVKVLRKALLDVLEETEESLYPSRKLRAWKIRLTVAALVLIVAASIVFHLLYHRAKTSRPDSSLSPSLLQSTPSLASKNIENISPSVDAKAPLPSTLKGKDAVTLHLIPKGKLTLPVNFGPEAGKTLEIEAFYLDETEVTNRKYVDFLNQVLPRIRVEKGVVKGDGNIWLLLEEVMEGYDPIVFHNGKFLVTNPEYDCHAVVRVTAYGAEAYARFYGKRLPTEVEWWYAMKETSKKPKSPSSQPQVPTPVSVDQFRPNAYGVKGLDGNVSEWGVKFRKGSSHASEEQQYIVLGGLRADFAKEKRIMSGIIRYPWEGLEEVGFRCILDIPGEDG
ncbi:MAG: bifunctional serine/threonine-protein kinase/formylglycine-generating enzyme family protein [Pseudomonadota bacterium]